jgi:hypothetical protein
MLGRILRTLSPESLKKYGMYAVLYLSLMLNVYFIAGERMRNERDIKYERARTEKIEKVLLEQVILQKEQKELLKQIDSK